MSPPRLVTVPIHDLQKDPFLIRLFWLASIIFIVVGISHLINHLQVEPPRLFRAAMSAALIAAGLGSIVLIFFKHYARAFQTMVCLGWLVTTAVTVVSGGIYSPNLMIYPLLIFAGGFMLSVRTGLVIAVLSALATLAFAITGSMGVLPAAQDAPMAVAALTAVAILIAAALCVYFFTKSYQSSYETARELSIDLGRSEARLHHVLSVAGERFWDWDFRTDRVTYDKRWCLMMGFDEGRLDIPSAEFFALVHEDDRAAVMERVTGCIDGGGAYSSEHRVRRPDGRVIWVQDRGDLFERDHDGKPLHMIGSVTDISERKEAEARHSQLEAQLRESQKMESLGTLAGGVAHDFNNVLAAIAGNVELARQDVGRDHAALVSLEEIDKASRRAKDLVQQILAFGRKQKTDRRATSLALVVAETARMLRATLPAGVSLNFNCAADTPVVLADATQVQQIILNLCTNALQAVQRQNRPGVIDILLASHEHAAAAAPGELKPGRYACLSVRDNGVGMDEATRSRIFEPFFTTKAAGEGTGLGLSVVYGIVQTHEARIEVESAPGEGSIFRIYFHEVEAPLADVAVPVATASPESGGGKHVLYVDDEEAIIFLMTRLLERKGFRVSAFTDPCEAVAAARVDPGQFDLAVTDFNMPGMSGLEVAVALHGIRADLPVVMASGFVTDDLRKKALAAGVREVIYKPNTVDELCDAVVRLS